MIFGTSEIIGSFLIFCCVSVSHSVKMMGVELVLVIIKILFDFQHKEAVILLQPPMMVATLVMLSVAFLDRDQYFQNHRKVDIKFACVMMPMVFIG